MKVEEKRIQKRFDVYELITDDFKDMMEFLQLSPDDERYSLDKKINSKAKPSKLFFIPEGES